MDEALQKIQVALGLKHPPNRMTNYGIPYSISFQKSRLRIILFVGTRHGRSEIRASKNNLMRTFGLAHIDVIPYDNPNLTFDKKYIKHHVTNQI